MGVKHAVQGILHAMDKNSPYILTGIALGGNFAGTVLAIKVTPQALADIRKAEMAKGSPLTPQEIVKAGGKNYILPLIVIAVSDICGILGIRKSERGKAAIASAALMTENWAKEYQQKVVDHLGKDEEQKIRDELNQDRVEKALLETPKPDWVPQVGTGNQLFYYIRHNQWFRSDVETIRCRVNDFNQMLVGSFNGISEEEFEEELGLEHDASSKHFGWNPNRALAEVYFIFPRDHEGFVSPWGEGAIGLDFRDGHEPMFGYDAVGDTYCS